MEKIISIAKFEYSKLKYIKQLKIEHIVNHNYINQIIPGFFLTYNYIQRIVEMEKELEVNTLRQIINHDIKTGKEVVSLELTSKYQFFDIDDKMDLLRVNSFFYKKNKGKDNSTLHLN